MKRFKTLLFILFINYQFIAQPLSGTKWMLMSMDNLENGKSTQITASIKAFITFEADSSYSGRFCNTYNGRIRTNAARQVKMTVPMATKLVCLGVDNYEKEMFELIPKVTKYRIEDGFLYLFTINRKRITFKVDK